MSYPLNTPLGRFGVRTLEHTPERCVASMPVHGLRNPLTGLPTVAPLAMLVDHLGGLANHLRRAPDEWTVTSELSLDVAPDAHAIIAAAPEVAVLGTAAPLGHKDIAALGQCELRIEDTVIATATVRSFYITAPAGAGGFPDGPSGPLPPRDLATLMAVQIGESGGTTKVLSQLSDPVLNNNIGIVHGGVSSMGLELVASAAINSSTDGHPFHTASLRVNFLRPFHGGHGARYVGTALRVGGRSGLAESQAVGADGTPVLLARVTAYR